jgi:hypothetical protein
MDVATTAWMQEVERRRMPKPRAAMGQGWPFVGGPHPVGLLERRWSERTLAQPGPDERAEGFGYFCQQKSLAREGETKDINKNATIRNKHSHKLASPV